MAIENYSIFNKEIRFCEMYVNRVVSFFLTWARPGSLIKFGRRPQLLSVRIVGEEFLVMSSSCIPYPSCPAARDNVTGKVLSLTPTPHTHEDTK